MKKKHEKYDLNTVGRVAIWLENIIYFFVIMVSVVLTTMGIVKTVNQSYKLLLVLLTSAVVIIVLFKIFSKYRVCEANYKIVLPTILLIAFLIRMFYIIIVNTQPESDFQIMYENALNIVNGTINWTSSNNYLYNWANVIPFVWYESLVIRVFGSLFALKVMNVLFAVGCTYFIYLLCLKIATKNSALIIAFFYAIFPQSIYMSSVLTNQIIALFFTLLGIVLLVYSQNKWYYGILSGISLCIAEFMRPEGIVIILALLCYILLQLVTRPNYGLKETLLCIFSVLISYFLLKNGVSVACKFWGVAPNGLNVRCMEWKFVLGLDFTSDYGGYSEKNEYILGIIDDQERRRETIRIIVDSFKQCDNVFNFFIQKIYNFWHESSIGWSTWYVDLNNSFISQSNLNTLIDIIKQIELVFKTVMYALVGIGTVSVLYTNKRKNFTYLLCTLLFLATFFIYLLIEVQPRYNYYVMAIVFVLASVCLDFFQMSIRKR